MNKKVKVALVDDHILLRKGLASLISSLGYEVHLDCSNGSDLINKIDGNDLPDVILMDINMPVMNGYDTTLWLTNNHPQTKVLALSMYDHEISIIRMIKNGARGYILKDTEPAVLQSAIDSVLENEFYYSDMVTGRLLHRILQMNDNADFNFNIPRLTDREVTLLKFACEELTYKEIADRMGLSPKTIDGHRDELFRKLDVKSRVGLVIFAVTNGIVEISTPALKY